MESVRNRWFWTVLLMLVVGALLQWVRRERVLAPNVWKKLLRSTTVFYPGHLPASGLLLYLRILLPLAGMWMERAEGRRACRCGTLSLFILLIVTCQIYQVSTNESFGYANKPSLCSCSSCSHSPATRMSLHENPRLSLHPSRKEGKFEGNK
jgi:hypothetical protein